MRIIDPISIARKTTTSEHVNNENKLTPILFAAF